MSDRQEYFFQAVSLPLHSVGINISSDHDLCCTSSGVDASALAMRDVTVLETSPREQRMSFLAGASLALQHSAFGMSGDSYDVLPANISEPACEPPCVINLDSTLGSPSHTTALPVVDSPVTNRICSFGFGRRHLWDLLQFVPWSSLLPPPDNLEKPERFAAWVDQGKRGCCPSEDATLIISADGSFHESTGRAGWGLVFSFRTGSSGSDATFLGCAYGNVNVALQAAGEPWKCKDAHLAESTGLFWAAVSTFQLRTRTPFVFESDCQSALLSVEGRHATRDHPLCQAAKALHAALAFHVGEPSAFHWTPGHAGLVANELADALARRGAFCDFPAAPFQVDLAMWLSPPREAVRWIPHVFWALKFPQAAPGSTLGMLCWADRLPDLGREPSQVIVPFLPPDICSSARPVSSRKLSYRLGVATYNVLSIIEPKNGQPAGATGLHAEVGRVKILEQSLTGKGVHLAGLQETRAPEGQTKCGPVLRFCTGPDEHHNYGCEVWIDVETRFGDQVAGFQFSASHVVVQHTEPTAIVLRVKNHALDFQIASMHGPHRARSSLQRQAWWQRISSICKRLDAGGMWILCLDGNCRIGSETSKAVSCHQADEEDEAGGLAHALLLELRAFVPSTFVEHMQGPGSTLFHKRGSVADRSDFVCIPQAWQCFNICAYVDPAVNVGHRCVDHLCSIVHIDVVHTCRPPPKSKGWGISADALRDPANRHLIEQVFRSMPVPEWSLNIHEHVAIVTAELQHKLHDLFPAERRRMRAGYFSEETASLHRALGAARRMLRLRLDTLRNTLVRCAFLAWQGGWRGSPFMHFYQGRWLGQLRCNLALDTFRIGTLGKVLRNRCRRDKVRHVNSLADELQQAPDNAMHAAFKELVRPKKFLSRCAGPLPRLKKEDGTFCQTPERIQQRWRRHFASIEAGKVVEPCELVERCQATQHAKGSLRLDTADVIPSFLQLEATLKATPARKAAGPDRIPPDICRLYSHNVTELLWPVLLKSVLFAAEAAGHKGSVLHRLPKPGGIALLVPLPVPSQFNVPSAKPFKSL